MLVLRVAIFLVLSVLARPVLAQVTDIRTAASGPYAKHVLAFYYGWYGTPAVSGRWVHWHGVDLVRRTIANSTHYPVLGPYDSHDPNVVQQHCLWAQQAGLTGFIVSWWHPGDFHDRGVPLLLNTAAQHGLSVTVYYETARSVAAAIDNIRYLHRRYMGHRAWLRHGKSPVLFVYGRAIQQLGLDGWRQVMDATREQIGPVVFIGDRLTREAETLFDGVHAYNITGQTAGKSLDQIRAWARDRFARRVRNARALGRPAILTIIPGYDDSKLGRPRPRPITPRYAGATYRVLWQEAVRARPDWILVTSFNEWHEGSEIEPSLEHGDRELKTTAEFAKPFVRGQ